MGLHLGAKMASSKVEEDEVSDAATCGTVIVDEPPAAAAMLAPHMLDRAAKEQLAISHVLMSLFDELRDLHVHVSEALVMNWPMQPESATPDLCSRAGSKTHAASSSQ